MLRDLHTAVPGVRRAARRGATLSEYAIIIGAVAMIVMVMVFAFGNAIAQRFRVARHALATGTAQYQGRYEVGTVGPLDPVNIPAANNPNLPSLPPIGPTVGPGSGRAIPPGADPHYSGGNLGNPSGWDPVHILTDLTQVDQRNDTVFDPLRCTRTSHLAAAIMDGPGAVRRIIDDMARQIQQGRQPFVQQPGGIAPIPPDQALRELGRIRDRLDTGDFDFNDSGMLIEIMAHYFQAQGNATGPVGLWPSGMNNLGQPATRAPNPGPPNPNLPAGPGNQPPANPNGPLNQAQFQHAINDLQPGEAIRFVIEWPKTPPTVKDPVPNDHTVLIGRDPDGRIYLYDPAPKAPNRAQLVYADTNPQEFNWYMQAPNTMGSDGNWYLSGGDPNGATVIRFGGGR